MNRRKRWGNKKLVAPSPISLFFQHKKSKVKKTSEVKYLKNVYLSLMFNFLDDWAEDGEGIRPAVGTGNE